MTTITPHQSDAYEPGAILEHSWGWEQTNIDFFVILKRSDTANGTWLTLQEMGYADKTETGFMTGDCTPGAIRESAKPIRRKLHSYNGDEAGVRIHRSYGWAALWDGKPSRWSSYA